MVAACDEQVVCVCIAEVIIRGCGHDIGGLSQSESFVRAEGERMAPGLEEVVWDEKSANLEIV